MLKQITLAAAAMTALVAAAPAAQNLHQFTLKTIDGKPMPMSQYKGKVVLLVNTASMCGFTPQYEGLQELYDAYRGRGLVVLAVPSDDFRQELSSAEEVKEFCAVNFGLDLPMTDITPVKGPQAHPFFAWVKAQTGFVPKWNFNKVLIDGEGRVAGTWPSGVEPMSPAIRGAVEAALGG